MKVGRPGASRSRYQRACCEKDRTPPPSPSPLRIAAEGARRRPRPIGRDAAVRSYASGQRLDGRGVRTGRRSGISSISECLAEARHHLRRQQGMAAQLEEVFADAHAVDPQDVRPGRGDGPLGGRAGGLERPSDRRPAHFGRGQGVAVELAVRREGQGWQGDERGGDHVRRQRGPEPLPQLAEGEAARTRPGGRR